jgi:aryl-alcohol dehydrogenase-like predicted oxidoreductase
MKYITIPGTDIEPSTLCFGTSQMGTSIGIEASFALLDTYVEHGGNFLDTASVYANWLTEEESVSEKTLGRWLAERGLRDRVLVGTKGGHPDLSTMHISRLSRADIVHDLEASLRNLRRGAIDLYWLHRDDPSRPVGEILEVLDEQARAGKIRCYGCSNWRPARIREAQAYAVQHDLQGFVADQMMWSLARAGMSAMADTTMVSMDEEQRRYHLESEMAAIPYSSQANGFYQKMAAGTLAPDALPRYRSAENEARFQRVQQLSAEIGLSITQIVLGYLQSQPFPTIPVIGCKTMAHLEDSLTGADVRLSAEQVRYLEGD